MNIREKTIELIDSLKATCKNYGLGNDGNEYKIITQVFLYKFLNDKLGHDLKLNDKRIAKAEKWDAEYMKLSEDEQTAILNRLGADSLRLYSRHLLTSLYNQEQKGDFDIIFDATMEDIATINNDIFVTKTVENTKVPVFEKLTIYVTDTNKRAAFARALVDKLVNFSFEDSFDKSYDFFAQIFEYLIKDYNTAGGGKYAEYYTPHAIATIMAKLLVGKSKNLHNIECYDPSAGTGTLLMALAHEIGEDKCTMFSQDISQRSSKMLKLNLILNGLVSSLDNAIQGDTLVSPYHLSDDGKRLRTFDFVVSNPPFNMDFRETRDEIAVQKNRFWAGVPNIPKKDFDSMAIYTCFIQHVVNSLIDKKGKGAIVVPTGFLTAKSGTERKVLERIIDEEYVSGAISMPSNVFANTGTNVSVLFLDKSKENKEVVLIDATNLGEEYKEDNKQKRRLKNEEIDLIVNTFLSKKSIDNFSAVVTFDEIKEKNYSLSAGQHFNIRIEYEKITKKQFEKQLSDLKLELENYLKQSNKLGKEIIKQLEKINYEK